MVNIVQNYSNDYNSGGYRETNHELAKENSELRHQLQIRDAEFSEYRQEILEKDLIIIELRRKLKEHECKLDAITDIILGEKLHPPIEPAKPQQQSDRSVEVPILPLPSTATSNSSIQIRHNDTQTNSLSESTNQNEEDSVSIQMALNRISERSERDTEADKKEESQRQKQEDQHRQLPSDSLDPPDVTSVPPFQPERILHTPSIWNILDSTEAPENGGSSSIIRVPDNFNSPIRPTSRASNVAANNQGMLQSTPVQIKKNTSEEMFDAPKAKRQKRQQQQQTQNKPPKRYNLRNRKAKRQT